MAGAPLIPPPEERHYETVIKDAEGREVLRFRNKEEIETKDDGAIVHHHTYETRELGDGVIWTAMMLQGKDPVMLAGCSFCRRRRDASESYCTLQNAARCTRCQRICCPRHTRRGADGQALCPSCAPLAGIWRFLRAIFWDA